MGIITIDFYIDTQTRSSGLFSCQNDFARLPGLDPGPICFIKPKMDTGSSPAWQGYQ